MSDVNSIISSVLSNYYSSTSTTVKNASSSSSTSTSSSTTSSSSDYSNTTAVGRYLNSTDASEVDGQTLFDKISIDVGGDGKSISKSQLETYISSAESGSVNIPDSELSVLKNLDTNWTSIMGSSSDSMQYYDLQSSDYKNALSSMIPTPDPTIDYQKIEAENRTKINNELVSAALGTSAVNGESTTSTLTSMLKTLLTGTTDENDDANAESVASLTNLIANYSNTSTTIETEA